MHMLLFCGFFFTMVWVLGAGFGFKAQAVLRIGVLSRYMTINRILIRNKFLHIFLM